MISNGRDIIRAGYESGTPCAEIARQCDSTINSVRVIAHRMGIGHAAQCAHRVPPEKMEEYRFFKRTKKVPAAVALRLVGVST